MKSWPRKAGRLVNGGALPRRWVERYKPRHAASQHQCPHKAAAKASPKVRRTAAPRRAPRVGLVSLGCPKALVNSERIITKLRAEGYELSADYAGADVVVVNTCGFLDRAKQESLDAIGEAMAENGRVIVTGCFGVEEARIRDAHPGVLAVTGPHQYEQVVRRRARRGAAAARSVPRSRAAGGPAPDAAPLRLSEDFRGLQQPLLVLHHPAAARRSRQPAGRRT